MMLDECIKNNGEVLTSCEIIEALHYCDLLVLDNLPSHNYFNAFNDFLASLGSRYRCIEIDNDCYHFMEIDV